MHSEYYEYEKKVDNYHLKSKDDKLNSFRLKLFFIKSTNGMDKYEIDACMIDSLCSYLSKHNREIREKNVNLQYINATALIIAHWIVATHQDKTQQLDFFKKHKLCTLQTTMIARYAHFLASI